jgi:ubiquinone/menaquinone biosynthesis C-methylase UbiE
MLIPSLATRQRTDELMDEPDVDPQLIDRSLRFIRRINVLFGYTRATLGHLKRFSADWKHGQRIEILDVATGSADVPLAVARWGRQRGFDLRITGLDRHPLTADLAAAQVSAEPSIRIVRGDAMALPFADGSFDYAMTSMFLHHLDEQPIVQVLREMNRVARRGVIVADLLRHRRAYAWITLFTCLANPMVKHDARVSVAQAFRKNEVLRLRDQADIKYATYFRHFGHRFVLAGEREIAGV